MTPSPLVSTCGLSVTCESGPGEVVGERRQDDWEIGVTDELQRTANAIGDVTQFVRRGQQW